MGIYKYQRADNGNGIPRTGGTGYYYRIQLQKGSYQNQLFKALFPDIRCVDGYVKPELTGVDFENHPSWQNNTLYAYFFRDTLTSSTMSLCFSTNGIDLIDMSGWFLTANIYIQSSRVNFTNNQVEGEVEKITKIQLRDTYFIFHQWTELDLSKTYDSKVYQLYKGYDGTGYYGYNYNGERLIDLPGATTAELDKGALLQPVSKAYGVSQNNINATPLDFCRARQADDADYTKKITIRSGETTNHLYTTTNGQDATPIKSTKGGANEVLNSSLSDLGRYDGDKKLYNLGFFNTNTNMWELIDATNSTPILPAQNPKYAYVIYEFHTPSVANGGSSIVKDNNTITVTNNLTLTYSPNIYISSGYLSGTINVSNNSAFKTLLGNKTYTNSASGTLQTSSLVDTNYTVNMNFTIAQYIKTELSNISLSRSEEPISGLRLMLRDTTDYPLNGIYEYQSNQLFNQYSALASRQGEEYIRTDTTPPRRLFDYSTSAEHYDNYTLFLPIYQLSCNNLKASIPNPVAAFNIIGDGNWIITDKGFMYPSTLDGISWAKFFSYTDSSVPSKTASIKLYNGLDAVNDYVLGIGHKDIGGGRNVANIDFLSALRFTNTSAYTYYVYRVPLSDDN